MIRLLVDGRAVVGALHGIARYTLEIVRHLPQVAPDLRPAVLCHPDSAALFRDLGATTVSTRRPFAAPLAPLTLGRFERLLRPDVLFCPSFVAPASPRCPLVMTIHDATHLLFAEDYTRWVGLFYRAISLPAARAAAQVITVSEYSRSSLREVAGLEEVAVVHNGVDHDVFTPDGATNPRLKAPTVLYAGGFKPHKRFELLIDAVARLPGVCLAVAGSPTAAQMSRARVRGVGGRLTLLGALTDHELAAAYRSASVFAYPSLHEGFGLPPLEAMACGTPVVCADASSLPEVVGDDAELFRGDAVELRNALKRVLEDRDRAAALGARGLRRASTFTWEATAGEVAGFLRAAAQRDRR